MQSIIDIKTGLMESAISEFAFGYSAELIKAKTMSDLNQRIMTIIKQLGFSDYSYIQLSRADMYQEDLCSLPTDLMNSYYDNSLFVYDMSLQKAVSTNTSFFRSEIHDYVSNAPFLGDIARGMNDIYELNKGYGYYDYYHVSICSNTKLDPVMLSVAQRGITPFQFKQDVKGCESTLSLLCEAIERVLHKKFPKFCYKKIRDAEIKPKPLRVLQTLANSDMTIEQVAEKLCISVVTANQHLKTVRNSLNAKTNYAAIKRAVLEDLIQYGKPY